MLSLTASLVGFSLSGSVLSTISPPLSDGAFRLPCAVTATGLCSAARACTVDVTSVACLPPNVALREGGLPWAVTHRASDPPAVARRSWGWHVINMSSVAAAEARDARSDINCLGPYEPVRWNTASITPSWLGLRLSQLESLQPQRCVIAPTICLMRC